MVRSRRTRARGLTLLAAGVLFSAGSVLGLAAPALAHNYLVSSTPSSGETLTVLPESFEITTNEALLEGVGDGSFALEVVDADGRYYGDGCVTVAGATMSTAAAIGEPGEYTVIWQVVSADGHTISAEFTFAWAPTGTSEATEGSATPPVCSAGGTSSSSSGGTDESNDSSPADSDASSKAELSNVLWIGGAIVLVGLSVGVTLLLTGRTKPQKVGSARQERNGTDNTPPSDR